MPAGSVSIRVHLWFCPIPCLKSSNASTRKSSRRPPRAAGSADCASPPSRNSAIPSSSRLRSPPGSKASGFGTSTRSTCIRITWKNDVNTGLFGGVNYLEIPPAITGVKARIIGLTGKFFPTGAHKVGAAFGCLVPRLVSGEFDPDIHKAVWPSTGNYCRGGAFDCALLDCTAIAILPEEMSRERFEWLKQIGAQVIATPGCESNVKEIYDKCWELRKDPLNVIFNQFDEFGNPIFHYNVTGPAFEEVLSDLGDPQLRPAAYVSATGSAGTIAAGDLPQDAVSGSEDRGHRGTAMPDSADERLRRPPHRGDRRQACPLGPQRAQHGRGRRHRRRGLPADSAPVQRARRLGPPGLPRRRRAIGQEARLAGHLQHLQPRRRHQDRQILRVGRAAT